MDLQLGNLWGCTIIIQMPLRILVGFFVNLVGSDEEKSSHYWPKMVKNRHFKMAFLAQFRPIFDTVGPHRQIKTVIFDYYRLYVMGRKHAGLLKCNSWT